MIFKFNYYQKRKLLKIKLPLKGLIIVIFVMYILNVHRLHVNVYHEFINSDSDSFLQSMLQ